MKPPREQSAVHVMDLSAHEIRRLAAVHAAESEARRLLSSDLDAEQQSTLRLLIERV